jgi:hypothetical protein
MRSRIEGRKEENKARTRRIEYATEGGRNEVKIGQG